MYINFWYLAAQSGEVPAGAERPLKVQILGHHSALWRDQSGKVRRISDTCSHRGGALADGRIRGDCIECPYHGRTFNGDGVSDLPETERRPIIDIPEFDDPV
jgi:phenylpropionate dioxygenase-like ring-hydroxylating dioxygenase large terminal subunit